MIIIQYVHCNNIIIIWFKYTISFVRCCMATRWFFFFLMSDTLEVHRTYMCIFHGTHRLTVVLRFSPIFCVFSLFYCSVSQQSRRVKTILKNDLLNAHQIRPICYHFWCKKSSQNIYYNPTILKLY